MEFLVNLALKTQTVFGCIHFGFFIVSWPTVIGLLKKFLDDDRLSFNCVPEPSDVIRQLCYEDYTSTVSRLLIPLYFAFIVVGILGISWLAIIFYSALLVRKNQSEKLKWGFLVHACIQLVVLGLMISLFCCCQIINLPVVYMCSQRNTTEIPVNQEKNMTCNDFHYKQKSQLNIGIITIMAISIVFCASSIIHLLVYWETIPYQLVVAPTNEVDSRVPGQNSQEVRTVIEMAQAQGNVSSTTSTPSDELWNKKINSLIGFHDVLSQLKIKLDPERHDGKDYRLLASKLRKTQGEIRHLGSLKGASPTEILLYECNLTLNELKIYLQDERPDVVDVITDWVQKTSS